MKIRAMVLAAAATLAAGTGLAAPGVALARQDETTRAQQAEAYTRFKCQDGVDLIARFDSHGARLVAIIDDARGPPHSLPIQPWEGGPVQLTWSDGVRTLTWSPGVQIMWMNGDGSHHMCGREGGHHH